MIQKSKRSRPFIAHVDKLKLYEGETFPSPGWRTLTMDRLVVLTESEFTRGVMESTTMGPETLNPESTGFQAMSWQMHYRLGWRRSTRSTTGPGTGTSSGSQHRVTVSIHRFGRLARSTGPCRRTTCHPWSRLRVSPPILAPTALELGAAGALSLAFPFLWFYSLTTEVTWYCSVSEFMDLNSWQNAPCYRLCSVFFCVIYCYCDLKSNGRTHYWYRAFPWVF